MTIFAHEANLADIAQRVPGLLARNSHLAFEVGR